MAVVDNTVVVVVAVVVGGGGGGSGGGGGGANLGLRTKPYTLFRPTPNPTHPVRNNTTLRPPPSACSASRRVRVPSLTP